MKRILVPIGCRSDEGLSAPVIKRLREHFDVHTMRLEPQDFGRSYLWVENELGMNPYDLILITGDRVEMCAAAAAAFHNKVKIAHFYGGVINRPKTTFDDTDRDVISLWSDIHFVESLQCGYNVAELTGTHISSMPLNPERELAHNDIYVVGISHLDDLEIDEDKVPLEPYDLVLYNSPSSSDPNPDISEIVNRLYSLKMILIGGNPDGNDWRKLIPVICENYLSLPRPKFLGLLKNCQRFITNSSAAIYEAPHFLKPEQIVMVGDRNRNRPRGPFKIGASDRIVEILREHLK